ncbi:hypothetical protein ACIP1U_07510 [Cupriavidus sp. NPDC089707]|uniref:hypothetical protein n=1 Tax=Cupriavidus sp. NPDC089707 TaxID=3363963 RepID=UPI0037FE05DD
MNHNLAPMVVFLNIEAPGRNAKKEVEEVGEIRRHAAALLIYGARNGSLTRISYLPMCNTTTLECRNARMCPMRRTHVTRERLEEALVAIPDGMCTLAA